MLKKPLFIETLVFLAVLGVLHVIAIAYHLYWSIYEFDSLVHFLAGITLSLFFLWLYFFSGLFDPPKRTLGKFLLVAVLGAMLASVLWEIYELIFDQTMAQKADYAYDVTLDLIIDLLGAMAGCFYGYIKEYNRQMILKNESEYKDGQS